MEMKFVVVNGVLLRLMRLLMLGNFSVIPDFKYINDIIYNLLFRY